MSGTKLENNFMQKNMNILIFCSASELEEKYSNPAKQFAKLLPENGYGLVWGGSDRGLMKEIASAVQKAGGKITGVTFELLKHRARKNADEMIVTKDLSERKATMLARADAVAVLVGGIGTLDEITEVLELKKHGIHNKPVVVLNTENFYSGFQQQLQTMKDNGFIQKPLEDLIYFTADPKQAIAYINQKLNT